MHDGPASRAYVAPMLSIAYITTHVRTVPIAALVLLAAILLLVFGLLGGDEAEAAMACRSPRGC